METNQELITLFFKQHRSRENENTCSSYQTAIDQFFSFCPKHFTEVSRRDIQNWRNHLRSEELKISTISARLSALRELFRFAQGAKLISLNPAWGVKIKKKDSNSFQYLNKTELFQLKEAAANIRERAIVQLFCDTALRPESVVSIKIEDIDWENKRIYLVQKGSKKTYVVFTEECKIWLEKYLAQRNCSDPYLFVSCRRIRYTRQGIWKLIKRLGKKAGKKLGNRAGIEVNPRILRRTGAMHLVEREAPAAFVQRFLNHENPSSTKYYISQNRKAKRNRYDKVR